MSDASSMDDVDVLVVGGGGAGCAAAVGAAEAGASVLVIEKNPEFGGTTARAVGSVSASFTQFQRRAGIVDDIEQHFKDLGAFAGDLVEFDNLDLRRMYVEDTGPTVEWLVKLGVIFFGPMPEPPNKYPRMLNVLPNASAYIRVLRKAAMRLGARFETGAVAKELVIENGRVCGAVIEDAKGQRTIRANRGVVLAAGDFSASEELKERYVGAKTATVEALNPASTGDGIKLGLSAGGNIVNGHISTGPQLRFVWPPHKHPLQLLPPVRPLARFLRLGMKMLPDRVLRPMILAFATSYLAPHPNLFGKGAILVNNEGKRFTDERATPWLDLPSQPDGVGYIVLDGEMSALFTKWPNFISTAPGVAYAYLSDYRRSRKDIYHVGSTVDALAKTVGLPPENLEKSLAVGMPAGHKAPYVALGPVKSWIVTTEGGLAVDTYLRVLNENGSPIPGLYAAGSNGQGGVLLEGHGNHIGWAFVSGRRAGQTAMSD
jgi:fumarate reductase flavoprotein subunit